MDLDAFRELLTPDGRRALTEAVNLLAAGAEPVTAATTLRKTYSPALTSAALTQAALRRRAEAKFGADAAAMYFTPQGLEQATRAEVAAHRASRVTGPGPASGAAPRVLDVCCGIGGDLVALARAGCPVDAVDLDPLTAEVARANAAALGLPAPVRVRTADAAECDASGYDLVFADPARRSARGRVFDPMAYSPAWPAVLELISRARAACVKVAPGFPDEFIPDGAEVEWVSYKGEVKEAAIWVRTGLSATVPGAPGLDAHGVHGSGPSGPRENGGGRRATLLPSGATLTSTGAEVAAGPVCRYLYEPDGAAVRAHLVAEVAEIVKGHLLDPRIAYITGDNAVATEWAACYEITDVMPFSLKRLRAALRERNVGNVTIKKRGSAVDIERLRKDLRLSGANSMVIVLTRIDRRPYALLCHPATPG